MIAGYGPFQLRSRNEPRDLRPGFELRKIPGVEVQRVWTRGLTSKPVTLTVR